MTLSPLWKKLCIKPGSSVLAIDAPAEYEKLLAPLPAGAKIARAPGKKTFDVVHLFVVVKKDLDRRAKDAIAAVAEGGILWVSYPKKTSKVKTDISRDVGWKATTDAGWVVVSLVAVDDTWSAMRLKSGGEQLTAARKTRAIARALDTVPRSIEAPADLTKALAASPRAKDIWAKLSFSHKREYVQWIEGAKKPETRARRIDQAEAMLARGEKRS